MAKNRGVEIKWKFPDLLGKFKKSKPELMRFIAAQMQTNRAELFDSSGTNNGHEAWPAPKLRKGKPLMDRGTLKRAIVGTEKGSAGPGGVVRIRGNEVKLEVTLIYANMMNWGTSRLPDGVLRPKRAQALRIPVKGGKPIYAASVTIPPRRFDDWTSADKRELGKAMAAKITEILNG